MCSQLHPCRDSVCSCFQRQWRQFQVDNLRVQQNFVQGRYKRFVFLISELHWEDSFQRIGQHIHLGNRRRLRRREPSSFLPAPPRCWPLNHLELWDHLPSCCWSCRTGRTHCRQNCPATWWRGTHSSRTASSGQNLSPWWQTGLPGIASPGRCSSSSGDSILDSSPENKSSFTDIACFIQRITSHNIGVTTSTKDVFGWLKNADVPSTHTCPPSLDQKPQSKSLNFCKGYFPPWKWQFKCWSALLMFLCTCNESYWVKNLNNVTIIWLCHTICQSTVLLYFLSISFSKSCFKALHAARNNILMWKAVSFNVFIYLST